MISDWRRAGSASISRSRAAALRCIAGFALLSVAAGLPAFAQQPASDGGAADALAFRVAKVVAFDAADSVINDAVVLVRSGKIEAVGTSRELKIPSGYRVYELAEHWLVPGLVDCHDHVSGSLNDLNDMVYQSNPGLDTRATIDPNNYLIARARTGGVTSVLLIPGSGTNISGFGTVTKTGGDKPSDVIVRSPGSLKIAQAGNPEWYMGGNTRSYMNWNTRQTLLKALAYHEQWLNFEQGKTQVKPEFDPTWDALRGLFRREFPASVHTQIYQVVMTTLEMLGREMKLWVVTDHSTFDGWKTAPLAIEVGASIVCGPRGFYYDRSNNTMYGIAASWSKNGVSDVSVNTDAPVIPQEELSYQAAMNCWYGWLPYAALAGVTRSPAKALGIYERTGSIEAKKDADFGIWTGDPLDPRSACLMTIVDGKVVYDASKGVRRF